MARKPKGRHLAVTADVERVVLAGLARGDSLRKLCTDDQTLPCRDTIREHLARNDDFAKAYARAKEIGREERFEAMTEMVATEPDVQRARLRWDNERWQLSKLDPKKYGDRQQMEHSGANGGPIQYANLSEEEIDARLAALTGAGPSHPTD